MPTCKRLSFFFACTVFVSLGHAFRSFSQETRIRVSGIPLQYNDQDSVPRGLFGVHSTSLNADRVADWGVELVRGIEAGPSGSPSFPGKNGTFPAGIRHTIDCYYDRYQPALFLSNRNGWKTQLENLGQTYATASQSLSHGPWLEFWNEPFLNWASKPGANYDNRWYDTSNAQVGGPVFRPGFAEPVKHLIWERKKWWVQVTPPVNDPVNFYVQLGNNWTALNNLAVGEELQIGSRRFRAVNTWLAKDSTQQLYYSALANADMYRQMYLAFARRVKQVNPGQRVAAGWGMQLHQDNWRPWFTQYKPTLDSCWQWMDGIHEHHYGGDTRFISAGYEIANAYSIRKFGKKMPMLNTEAGGFLDPQIPGNVSPGPPSNTLLRDRGAFQYTFREIVHHLARCPDKAWSRAAHEAHLNAGDGVAFRLLRDIRGRFLYGHSTSDNVWVVASTENDKLAVAVYNDNSSATPVRLEVKAPRGRQLLSWQGRLVKDSSSNTTIAVEYENGMVNDSIWVLPLTIAAKSGRSFTFTLGGTETDAGLLQIRQFFADTVLANVPANGSLSTRIAIDPAVLSQAAGARLKLILRNYTSGSLTVNNQAIPLQNTGFFTYLTLPADLLTTDNQLTFSGGSSGYSLWLASVEVLSGRLDSTLLTAARPRVENAQIRIYPNPARDVLRLDPGSRALFLFDALGRRVALREGREGLEIGHLPAGVYQILIQTGARTETHRFVKE